MLQSPFCPPMCVRYKPTGINQAGVGTARQVHPSLRTKAAVWVRKTGVDRFREKMNLLIILILIKY